MRTQKRLTLCGHSVWWAKAQLIAKSHSIPGEWPAALAAEVAAMTPLAVAESQPERCKVNLPSPLIYPLFSSPLLSPALCSLLSFLFPKHARRGVLSELGANS